MMDRRSAVVVDVIGDSRSGIGGGRSDVEDFGEGVPVLHESLA